MEIAKASLADLDGLVNLFDQYRVWYRKTSDLEKATDFLKSRLANGDSEIFIAKNDAGELVGFTQCYPLFSSTRMQRMWLLNDLFVEPSCRGQGTSKALINAAKDLARSTEAAGILLETEKSNEIGNQLYPRTGFHLEENNFYFWTTEPA